MSEPTTARYDLPPEDPGPQPGDAYVRCSRSGEPTGVWYLIVASRPVRHRHPRPYQRFVLSVVRQDGPPPAFDPESGQVVWNATTYPKGTDVDAYWERRLGDLT